MSDTSFTKQLFIICLHLIQFCVIFCSLISFPITLLALSVNSCREGIHKVWSLAEDRQLSIVAWSETKGASGVLPLSSTLSGLHGWIAHCFTTALAQTTQQNSGKSNPQCFLIRNVFFLTSNSHDYGRWIRANFWGYAKFNKRQPCQPWNRIFRASGDKFGLVGGTLIPGKNSWPLFYVLGHKDQVNAIIITSIKENSGLL